MCSVRDDVTKMGPNVHGAKARDTLFSLIYSVLLLFSSICLSLDSMAPLLLLAAIFSLHLCLYPGVSTTTQYNRGCVLQFLQLYNPDIIYNTKQ